MGKKNTVVYTVAVLILSVLLAIGLFFHYLKGKDEHRLLKAEAAEKPREGAPQLLKWSEAQISRKGLEIKTAGPGQLRVVVPSRGKVIVHPDYLAHVVPKVSGIAKDVRKNLGDEVRAGEIMAVLESREIAEAKANYLSALTKERLAKAALERELKLYKKGISPEQDYLRAQNIYENVKVGLQLNKQKLQAFGLNDEEIYSLVFDDNSDFRVYDIRAPINGTVIKRHISSGEFIQDTSTIYEVANLQKVWVEMAVYPQDLLNIKERQPIEIVAPIENQFGKGRVVYISPVIDEETLMIKVIAELDNPDGSWRAGTFVNTKITTDQIMAPLIIGKEALHNFQGTPCIYVVTPAGVERRPVRIGRRDPAFIEILAGLLPGERYIANQLSNK